MARSYRAEPSISRQRKVKAYKRHHVRNQFDNNSGNNLGDYIAY